MIGRRRHHFFRLHPVRQHRVKTPPIPKEAFRFMELAHLPDFYLGTHRVQPSLNQVIHGEEVARLAPKFMQVLVCLAEHPSEVVTRTELLDRVWPDTVVGEAVLTRAISALRKTFDDDPQQPQVIETVMKSGYRLLSPPVPVPPEVLQTTFRYPAPPSTFSASSSRPPLRHRSGAVPLALACVLLASWFALRSPGESTFPVEALVPLTSYYGEEYDPALSPDGERIAFIWLRSQATVPGKNDPDSFADLYVRRVDTEALLRLTTDAAKEQRPAWSPDGRHIVFIRCDEAGTALYVVPSVGGLAQPLTGLAFTDCAQAGRISWSPDGNELVFADRSSPSQPAHLVVLSLITLTRKVLTRLPQGAVEDRDPVYSPDGRLVAFTRGRLKGRDIYVVAPGTGEVRALTRGDFMVEGLDWTPDGRYVIFASRGQLWQVSVAGEDPSPVAVMNTYSSDPTTARTRDTRERLAFVQASYEVNLWRLAIDAKKGAPAPSSALSRFVASTRLDGDPRIAPDGERVAFISDRDGPCGLWVTDRDGHHLTRLTTIATDCMQMAFPQWSPDSRFLAFSAFAERHRDIFVVPVTGGPVVRLTREDSEETAPAWSSDGQWIYFGSDRTGRWELWRLPATGGPAEQVTVGGGFAAQSAPDGQAIYYTKPGKHGLWIKWSGTADRLLFDELHPDDATNWRAVEGGVYFLDRTDLDNPAISFFDTATGRTSQVAPLPTRSCLRLDIAPDGRWAILGQVDHGGRDLVLLTQER